jgi:hypothetical protein
LVWWDTPVVLAFQKLRQEDHEFEASLKKKKVEKDKLKLLFLKPV